MRTLVNRAATTNRLHNNHCLNVCHGLENVVHADTNEQQICGF